MRELTKRALGWGKRTPEPAQQGAASGSGNRDWLRQHPPVELNTSALTCHLGFFLPLVATETLDARLAEINTILTTIHSKYSPTQPIPHLDGHTPVSVIEMQWRSLRVRLRFSLHTEYVALALYIDVPTTTFATHHRVVSMLTHYLPAIPTALRIYSPAELKRRHTFLYETIWYLFFLRHKEIPSPRFSWSSTILLKKTLTLGNFRGIILRPSTQRLFDDRFVDELAPFLCFTSTISIDDLAICKMKNGRALYLSLLSTPAHPSHNYLLVSNSLSPKELGELVATGHRLGILRFVMIQPRAQLELAAHKLRAIEANINEIFTRFSSDENVPIVDIQTQVNKIRSDSFADVNKLFYVGGGSLRHRLRQSILYKKWFDDLLPRLAISPYMNYKTYSDATNNALSPTLDRIEELLTYYDVTDSDYVSLFQLVSSEVTAKKNVAIEKLQKNGEFILFLFPIPYYFAMLVEHTLRSDIAEAYQILIWICSVFYAFWIRFKTEEKPLRKRVIVNVGAFLLAVFAGKFMYEAAVSFNACGLLKEKHVIEQKYGWFKCSYLELPKIFVGEESKPLDVSGKGAKKEINMKVQVQGEQHDSEKPMACMPMIWNYTLPVELQHNVKRKTTKHANRRKHRRFTVIVTVIGHKKLLFDVR